MNRLLFYLRYALRSLRRDSTRTFLAGLSVTFGVLSLVAMQLLANALLHGEMFDQRIQYGGDAIVRPPDFGQAFTPSDLAQIETWREQGLIAEYTLIADGSAAYLRTSSNGRVTFLQNAFGIDVSTYPLIGRLVLSEPAGASAADVLLNPTDVLVTRDIAEQRDIHVGDTILLSGDSTPIQLTVAGIIGATPTQQGDSVFYSLETARLVENRSDVINTISLNWGTAPNAAQIVIDSPYNVYVAVDREDMVQSSSGLELFDVMLRGAGVLGLLIGGVSVSNTLQVILARRRLEIAMLKTLGYQQADLMMLISLETGFIGLVGGLVGAIAGAQIAGKLLDVLSGSGSIMLAWQPDPVIMIGGVVVGVLTAVVFGMQAILVSSATRPVQLLRDLPLKISRRTQLSRLALYVVMLFIFGVLVGVVLGAPLQGILYVAVGGVLVVLARALFWAVLWVTLKLPMPAFPMLRLARANLRQKKMQASLIVLALSAGAFSVSFAALSIYNAQLTVTRVRGSDEGYNLMVYTTTVGAVTAADEMMAQGAEATYVTERVRGTLNGVSIILEGRDAAELNIDMQYQGDWSEDEAVALLPENGGSSDAVGSMLTVNVSGEEYRVRLLGFYTADPNSLSSQGALVMVVPHQLMQQFDHVPLQTRVFGKFPPASLRQVTNAIGEKFPDMLVFSRADINDAMIATYQALFTFAAAVAGLALVAGAVLIANAAGLSLVERYREIGIFKAVGYTSSHVLRAFLSEYSFLGILAGLFGVVGAAAAITLINLSQPGTDLVIDPSILGSMLLFSVGIAVLSAVVVAWRPTRVRPLDVLRYE